MRKSGQKESKKCSETKVIERMPLKRKVCLIEQSKDKQENVQKYKNLNKRVHQRKLYELNMAKIMHTNAKIVLNVLKLDH